MDIFEKIAACGIIPVIKVEDINKAVPLADALRKGGINAIEVTARNAIAFDAIKLIKQAFPDMVVGAGTIISKGLVDEAIDAGAEFCVAPGFQYAVAGYCQKKNIPFVPGCSTPSEIENAVALGFSVLKFFPAEASGGVAALKLINGPFPNVKLIPTGGLTFDNIGNYLKLKCVAACGGSFMAKSDAIRNSDWDKIIRQCEKALKISRQARGQEQPRCIKSDYEIIPQAVGKTIVGFGDLLVSFSPDGYRRFIQADHMNVNYTGAEANVLASLSCFGMKTEFVTRLPKNPISTCAVSFLKRFDIGTDKIVYGGDRIGVIYTERGASQRPSTVVYDRKHSAICEANPEDFNWDDIFYEAGWFHFTGIAAGLSDSMSECCLAACKAAKAKGVTISCDLNYRKKLWTQDKAKSVMEELISYADVVIANEEDAEKVLGISSPNTDVETGKLNEKGYISVAKQICEKFGIEQVAVTLRKSLSASDNLWSAMLYDGCDAFFSKEYKIHVVNRVGGGDSFTAGLIYALANHYPPQETIEFAAAASCLKHSIEEDFNLVSLEEVEALVAGNGSGRVQR